MRPNPKRPVKRRPSKTNRKPVLALAAPARLPAADQALAHRHELELAEREKLRLTICERIGRYRNEVITDARRLVTRTNEAREIGLLVLKDWEQLPGKQMTIDFWEQTQEKYRDPTGQPILLDQLKWFVKIARNIPEPLDPDSGEDLLISMSYRQEQFGAAGFLLEGDAPGTHAAEPPNYFLQLKRHVEKWAQEMVLVVRSLEANPHFGPIEAWPADRRALFLAKYEPAYKTFEAVYRKLTQPAAIVVETGEG